jgi:hypothetical protein
MRWQIGSCLCLGSRLCLGSSLCLMILSAATVARADIADELATIPGMTLVEERPAQSPGFRFFVLSYSQPVNHLDPSRGSFEQRLTLLHRSESAPTVAFTSGYNLRIAPFRSEPTALVDGNQVGIEERFFDVSRPEPADYGDLDIYQAAADHHRVIEALRPLYPGRWLSTGASKGGMATVYHRRFFEGDIDGSVVYVAPNDVVDSDDAYAEFLDQVGNAPCRDRLHAVQRAALERRDDIVPVMEQVAAETGLTFNLVGSVDRAFELSIVELYWTFWQYSLERNCAAVPDADAPLADLIAFVGDVIGLTAFSDDNQLPFVPFFYQTGTELGYPDIVELSAPIADLLRYPGLDNPRTFVPADIPMQFDPLAMHDIDRWVKERGSQLVFIYGQNDPWSAEPFEPGPGTTDAYWYTAPGGNHGARITLLAASEQVEAVNTVLGWAGLAPLAVEPAFAASAEPQLELIDALVHATALDNVDLFESRPRL